MHGLVREQGAEVFEQHHLRSDRLAAIVAQVKLTQRSGGCVAHSAGAGGFPFQRPVMQNGAAVIGMNDEIDFDARTKAHRLDDALAGEDRIAGVSAGAMPFEPGPVAVAFDKDRLVHVSSDRLGGCRDRP
ncbi:hypothetical protein D3C72_1161990 [compost metagenome]